MVRKNNRLNSLFLHVCTGPARVLQGNDRFIGRKGAFGTTITKGSAAVVASQFGSTTTAPDARLRAAAPHIFGRTADGQWFFGITDNMDHHVLGGTSAAQRQEKLMDRDPGRVLIEIIGGKDSYTEATIIMPPGSVGCPAHTR